MHLYHIMYYQIGFITGWIAREVKGGKPPKVYVLVVPGAERPHAVQFMIASHQSWFYKHIATSRAIRDQSTVIHKLSFLGEFHIFMNELRAFRYDSATTASLSVKEANAAYDQCLGMTPIVLSEHDLSTKQQKRSLRLSKSIHDYISHYDSTVESRYKRGKGLNSQVKVGVMRARDEVLVTSEDIQLSHPLSVRGRDELLTTRVAGLFQESLSPIALAKSMREFCLEVSNDAITGSVFALFCMQLWWCLKPPDPQPLVVEDIHMDIDYLTAIWECSANRLLHIASLKPGASLGLDNDSVLDQNSCTYTFLKAWADKLSTSVLQFDKYPDTKSGHRARGVMVCWEHFSRKSAFVVSTYSDNAKRGWYHIPSDGAHSNACHISMKPHLSAAKPADVAGKSVVFECFTAVGLFLNQYWGSSRDLNSEEDLKINRAQRGNKMFRLYGGMMVPLLSVLLYSASTHYDISVAMQTFGGKRTGMSEIVSFDTMKQDPCGCGSSAYSSIKESSRDSLVFIFQRLIYLMSETRCLKRDSTEMEVGVGVTVRGAVECMDGQQQPAFAVFAERAAKVHAIAVKDEPVDDDEEDGEEVIQSPSFEDADHQRDHEELVENSKCKAFTFHPFSGFFCAQGVTQNLNTEGRQALGSNLKLKSRLTNAQIYCPSLNNPHIADAPKAFGVAAVTAPNGTLNTVTAKQHAARYVDTTKAFFEGFRCNDGPCKGPLGRMEVRVKVVAESSIDEAFQDLATICVNDLQGYDANTYFALSEFCVLSLRALLDVRWALEANINDPSVFKEWIALVSEIRAHAYTQFSGRTKHSALVMFSSRLQQIHRRAIFSMFNNHVNNQLQLKAPPSFQERFLALVGKHSGLQIDHILRLNHSIHEQLMASRKEILNPALTMLQQQVWRHADHQRAAALYCKQCFILLGSTYSSRQQAEEIYFAHPCYRGGEGHVRRFTKRWVGTTNDAHYKTWLRKRLTRLDDCQREVIRAIVQEIPYSMLLTGDAGVGKSEVLLMLYHVLVQLHGYNVVGWTSMLKVNAIKNGAETWNSFFQFPPNNEAMRKLDSSAHAARTVSDAKRKRMSQMKYLLVDEASNLSDVDFNKAHEVLCHLSVRCRDGASDLTPFGGIKVIMAMDPLQNPVVRTLTAFYRSSLVTTNFKVALFMEKINHRFNVERGGKAVTAWLQLLNRIRTLDFTVEDIAVYHGMIGGVLGNPLAAVSSFEFKRIVLLIDCVNALIINEERQQNDNKGYNRQSYMYQKGFHVSARLQPLYDRLHELDKSSSDKPINNASVIRAYNSFLGGDFTEEDFYKTKIVVTEHAQLVMYDKLLATTFDPSFNVSAVYQYYEVDQQGNERVLQVVAQNIANELKNTLDKMDINNDVESAHVVNLRPKSTRGISSNKAGPFLSKGVRVTIEEYFKETDKLLITPHDATGRNMVYSPIELARVSTTVDQLVSNPDGTTKCVRLKRSQFPICNGCAVIVNCLAGLTFTSELPLVLDNTRTSQAANLYIFSSRSLPQNLYLRHPLVAHPKHQGSVTLIVDGDGSVTGPVFDVKGNEQGLVYNRKAHEVLSQSRSHEIIFHARKLELKCKNPNCGRVLGIRECLCMRDDH